MLWAAAMCSGVPLWEATEMAFCSHDRSPSTSVKHFIIKGFIIERP